MTTTDRGRTLPPTEAQIEHVRQCPAKHVVLSGDKVDALQYLTPEHWVVGADLNDRPTTIGGGEPSRAGEPWHNPSFEFVVFEPRMLRREGDEEQLESDLPVAQKVYVWRRELGAALGIDTLNGNYVPGVDELVRVAKGLRARAAGHWTWLDATNG